MPVRTALSPILTRVPDELIVSIKVYQDPCPPVEESCEEGAGNSAEPIVDDAAMEMDTEVNDADKPEKEEEPAKPALDWYLGVSQDLKV